MIKISPARYPVATNAFTCIIIDLFNISTQLRRCEQFLISVTYVLVTNTIQLYSPSFTVLRLPDSPA